MRRLGGQIVVAAGLSSLGFLAVAGIGYGISAIARFFQRRHAAADIEPAMTVARSQPFLPAPPCPVVEHHPAGNEDAACLTCRQYFASQFRITAQCADANMPDWRFHAMELRKAYTSAGMGAFYFDPTDSANGIPAFFRDHLDPAGLPTIAQLDALVRSAGCCLWNALSQPVHHSCCQPGFYDHAHPLAPTETKRVEKCIDIDADLVSRFTLGAIPAQTARQILYDALEARHTLSAHPEHELNAADVAAQVVGRCRMKKKLKYQAKWRAGDAPATKLLVDYPKALHRLGAALRIVYLVNNQLWKTRFKRAENDQIISFHASTITDQPSEFTPLQGFDLRNIFLWAARTAELAERTLALAANDFVPTFIAAPGTTPEQHIASRLLRELLFSARDSLIRAAGPAYPPHDGNTWAEQENYILFNEQCGVVAHYFVRSLLWTPAGTVDESLLPAGLHPAENPPAQLIVNLQLRNNYVHFAVMGEQVYTSPAQVIRGKAVITSVPLVRTIRLRPADIVTLTQDITNHIAALV